MNRDEKKNARRRLLHFLKRRRGQERPRDRRPDRTRYTTTPFHPRFKKRRAAAKRAQQARLVAQHKRQAKRRKAKKANRG